MHLIYRPLYIVVDIRTRSCNYIVVYLFSHTLGSWWGQARAICWAPECSQPQGTNCFFHHPLFPSYFRNRFRTQKSIIILRLAERTVETLRRSRSSLGRVGSVLISSSHPSAPTQEVSGGTLSIWMWARKEGRERAMPACLSLWPSHSFLGRASFCK